VDPNVHRRPLVPGFLPLLVVSDQGLGLAVVDIQAFFNGLFLVIVALDERLARHVVLAGDLGRVENDMVGATARQMRLPAAHALDDLRVGHIDIDHRIDVDPGRLHGIGLRDGPGETVKQKAFFAVGLFDAFLHQADDHVVRHKPPRIHDGFGLFAELGSGLDGGAQHVARGNLRNLIPFLDVVGLGAFSRPRAAQQNQTHGKTSFGYKVVGTRC